MNDATDRTPFEQQAAYLARHLPPVILSNTDPTGRGRGKATARPLPPRGFSILVFPTRDGQRHLAFAGASTLHRARGFLGTLARMFVAVDTTAVEVK